AEGHEIKLITEGELHAIRHEWLKDPNEPDWKDSLPEIYRRVYGQDLNWLLDERVRFAGADAGLLVDLANDHGVVPEM
ncbi:DNA phosphorothioation system sulfurtransferase DndC, partial [Salmonella enterica]